MPDLQPNALLTDLYQLTMLQGYLDHGLTDTAVFEFFVRSLKNRNFLVAAGLEHLLDYLESLRFAETEIKWLENTGRFNRRTLDYLTNFRFTGEVYAMPEGTIAFANEPLVRVTAPLPEAQLIESRLINLIHYPTLIASKAARAVLVAPNKQLVDFGMRRAHGAEAALMAARACAISGFSGTATVEAGQFWGIPIGGTMAHAFIQAHDEELTAFEHFARSNPTDVTLLLDTYDTEAAAHKVIELARRLHDSDIAIRGVRLDSGDLAAHARNVRRILNEGGLMSVKIFASGNLDEYALAELIAAGAPIDGFGIGTRMDVSADAPYLDCAYKLEEFAGRARRKRSEGKSTWPGRKQVCRSFDADGTMNGDVLTLESDPQPGQLLLVPVMRNGRRLAQSPSLAEIQIHAAANLAQLPQPLRSLDQAPPYEVRVAGSIQQLAQQIDVQR